MGNEQTINHAESERLGVLLGISGLELALVARDQTSRSAATISLATAGAILALGSTATGFLIGWALALIIRPRKEEEPDWGQTSPGRD